MKKTAPLFFISAILLNGSLLAQISPPRQGKAVYTVTENGEHIPKVRDGELIFDERSSLFTDGKEGQKMEEVRKYDDNGNLTFIRKAGLTTVRTVFYSDFTNGKTVQWLPIQGRSFIISDTLRTPEWRLLDETKEINGMKCQKAMARVYGREYEAWFSAAIPLPYGPWKLNGLPGLIVEAHSTDGAIDFELEEIHSLLDDLQEIVPPSKGEKIAGYANFFVLQDKKMEEWIKSLEAKAAELSSETGSVTIDRKKTSFPRFEKTPTF